MRVLVNEQEIEVGLQGERNAGQVINGLIAWMANQGYGTSAISIDGEDILFMADWSDRPLAQVGDIHLATAPLKELRLQSLHQTLEWTEAMHASLEELSHGQGSISAVLGLIGNYPPVQSALAFLSLYDPSAHRLLEASLKHRLDLHIAECTRDDGSFNADELPAFAGTVYSLLVVCRDRLRELDSPMQELKRTALTLGSLSGDLGSIGAMLQTGQGKEAFARICTLSELLDKLLRLFWIMGEQGDSAEALPGIADWHEQARTCLQEIRDAIDAHDTVMLGDLLEYELPPLIGRILELVPGEE